MATKTETTGSEADGAGFTWLADGTGPAPEPAGTDEPEAPRVEPKLRTADEPEAALPEDDPEPSEAEDLPAASETTGKPEAAPAESRPESSEAEGETGTSKAKGGSEASKADKAAPAEDEAGSSGADGPVSDTAGGALGASKVGKGSGEVRGRMRRPGLQTVLTAVMLLALVASIAAAVVQWQRAGSLAEEKAARQEVRTRAAQFGVALLSYDHDNLKEARDKVMSMASDDFAKTYDVAFTGGLEGVIGKLEADATASVRAVYVNDMDAASAKAVVVMDSEVRSTAGTRRVLGSYLEMQLVRQGGQWKITEVSSIGTINESMSGPKGGQPSPSPSRGG